MIDTNDTIIGVFQDETTEGLSRLEEIVLNIAQKKDHYELEDTKAILRILHTIKGNAGFIPIKPIVELVSIMEETVKKAQEAESYKEPVFDLILAGIDFISYLLDHIETADEANPSTIINRFRTFLNSLDKPISADVADTNSYLTPDNSVKTLPISPPRVSKALKSREVANISLNGLRNRNEKRVMDIMNELLPKHPDFDQCRVCIEDVYALTMNNVQPEYSPEGSIIFRYKVSKDEIKEQVLQALAKVMKNPNH